MQTDLRRLDDELSEIVSFLEWRLRQRPRNLGSVQQLYDGQLDRFCEKVPTLG